MLKRPPAWLLISSVALGCNGWSCNEPAQQPLETNLTAFPPPAPQPEPEKAVAQYSPLQRLLSRFDPITGANAPPPMELNHESLERQKRLFLLADEPAYLEDLFPLSSQEEGSLGDLSLGTHSLDANAPKSEAIGTHTLETHTLKTGGRRQPTDPRQVDLPPVDLPPVEFPHCKATERAPTGETLSALIPFLYLTQLTEEEIKAVGQIGDDIQQSVIYEVTCDANKTVTKTLVAVKENQIIAQLRLLDPESPEKSLRNNFKGGSQRKDAEKSSKGAKLGGRDETQEATDGEESKKLNDNDNLEPILLEDEEIWDPAILNDARAPYDDTDEVSHDQMTLQVTSSAPLKAIWIDGVQQPLPARLDGLVAGTALEVRIKSAGYLPLRTIQVTRLSAGETTRRRKRHAKWLVVPIRQLLGGGAP